ncbi:MAG TPA: hypothetical protein VGN04_14555 [Herbaspirillum sp.]|jgi:hypothetical protein
MRGFSSSRLWLTVLGMVVLIVGLSIAYDIRTRAFESEAAHYHIVGDQVYVSQDADTKEDADMLRKYGGNAALITAAYKRKLHDLLQGKNLAYLLAIATIAAAACCFRAAWQADRPD